MGFVHECNLFVNILKTFESFSENDIKKQNFISLVSFSASRTCSHNCQARTRLHQTETKYHHPKSNTLQSSLDKVKID